MAKYVHIELRKIESAPGASPSAEIIGSKPIVLWGSLGSVYSELRSVRINLDSQRCQLWWRFSYARTFIMLRMNTLLINFYLQRDFAFYIRIPESVPPTISLDNGRASIRYELVATVCEKGKRSAFCFRSLVQFDMYF